MQPVTTYSFIDVTGALVTPFGVFEFNGAGLGDINIVMATDNAVIDMANDGVPIPSFVMGKNGTITINAPQNSLFNQFMMKSYNAIYGIPALAFSTTMTIRAIVGGIQHHVTGMGIQKPADRGYQKQSQMVSWVFPSCNIDTE